MSQIQEHQQPGLLPSFPNEKEEVANVDSSAQAVIVEEAPPPAPRKRFQLTSNRILSLDLVRGLAILMMIICNSQSGPAPFPILTHPDWIGFSIADSIFPSFLFCTGVTIPLAIRVLAKSDPNYEPSAIKKVYISHALKIFKRALIIMALGYMLAFYGLVQLHTNISNFRVPGVLQRIGFCYGIVGFWHLIVLRWGENPTKTPRVFSLSATTGPNAHEVEIKKQAQEKKVAVSELPLFARVTLQYWLPTFVAILWLIAAYSVQVKDNEMCTEKGMQYSLECSGQSYWDTLIFGEAHTYRHKSFDPEGSISTLTSILNVWFGWYIGCGFRTLMADTKALVAELKARRAVSGADVEDSQIEESSEILRIYLSAVTNWFWLGLLWYFIGWIFSFKIPFSKPSWTVTYAVASSGLTTTILAIMFYKFDVVPKIQNLTKAFKENSDRHMGVSHGPNDEELQRIESVDAAAELERSQSVLSQIGRVVDYARYWLRRSVVTVLGSMGRNAILLYLCSELVTGTCFIIMVKGKDDDGNTVDVDLFTASYNETWYKVDKEGWGSLFYSLGFAALHVLLAIFLDYKKLYFKV